MAIHQVGDHYVISAYQVWLPGSYESERAARYAFRFGYEQLQKLQDAANEESGGTGGTITMDALKKAAGQKASIRRVQT